MNNSMVAIQLWRWFLFHVVFGSIPVLVSVVFPRVFEGGEFGLPSPNEILFLTFMLSSLTFGDVIEQVANHGLNNFRLGLIALLSFGVILSLLLYGANHISPKTEPHLKLGIAIVLAAFFLIVGSLVQWNFWKAEQKSGPRKPTKAKAGN